LLILGGFNETDVVAFDIEQPGWERNVLRISGAAGLVFRVTLLEPGLDALKHCGRVVALVDGPSEVSFFDVWQQAFQICERQWKAESQGHGHLGWLPVLGSEPRFLEEWKIRVADFGPNLSCSGVRFT
jgi:hypothetical protein